MATLASEGEEVGELALPEATPLTPRVSSTHKEIGWFFALTIEFAKLRIKEDSWKEDVATEDRLYTRITILSILHHYMNQIGLGTSEGNIDFFTRALIEYREGWTRVVPDALEVVSAVESFFHTMYRRVDFRAADFLESRALSSCVENLLNHSSHIPTRFRDLLEYLNGAQRIILAPQSTFVSMNAASRDSLIKVVYAEDEDEDLRMEGKTVGTLPAYVFLFLENASISPSTGAFHIWKHVSAPTESRSAIVRTLDLVRDYYSGNRRELSGDLSSIRSSISVAFLMSIGAQDLYARVLPNFVSIQPRDGEPYTIRVGIYKHWELMVKNARKRATRMSVSPGDEGAIQFILAWLLHTADDGTQKPTFEKEVLADPRLNDAEFLQTLYTFVQKFGPRKIAVELRDYLRAGNDYKPSAFQRIVLRTLIRADTSLTEELVVMDHPTPIGLHGQFLLWDTIQHNMALVIGRTAGNGQISILFLRLLTLYCHARRHNNTNALALIRGLYTSCCLQFGHLPRYSPSAFNVQNHDIMTDSLSSAARTAGVDNWQFDFASWVRRGIEATFDFPVAGFHIKEAIMRIPTYFLSSGNDAILIATSETYVGDIMLGARGAADVRKEAGEAVTKALEGAVTRILLDVFAE